MATDHQSDRLQGAVATDDIGDAHPGMAKEFVSEAVLSGRLMHPKTHPGLLRYVASEALVDEKIQAVPTTFIQTLSALKREVGAVIVGRIATAGTGASGHTALDRTMPPGRRTRGCGSGRYCGDARREGDHRNRRKDMSHGVLLRQFEPRYPPSCAVAVQMLQHIR